MTPEQIKKYLPNASPDFIRVNPQGIHPAEPERAAKLPLERPVSREEEGHIRLEICFTVYSRRPLDWDNWRTKELQDGLILAGILPSDDWSTLQGRVISKKVHSKEEERTEVRLTLSLD